MATVEETDLTWECGFARVGIHYLHAKRAPGGWAWSVDDGESYIEITSGIAATEREARAAAIDALLAHLEKCAAECRAALEALR